ncbi:MAG: recombinase A [Deltaproteobacteria bacterium]|nr:recombinase A [Deltaproteobacteria bacterium]MBW2361183.1 recombinase A [Deltaproteobacteria bacterium]
MTRPSAPQSTARMHPAAVLESESADKRAAVRQLRRSFTLPESPAPPTRWALDAVAGTLTEVSAAGASASLTLAFALVLDAQRRGEPVAWFTVLAHSFFPPDAAENGADLEALVVVRLRDARRLARAAEQLARSGAFGLLLLDLGTTRIPAALLMRLAGLAQKHGTAIVFLTHKDADAPSLGSLISLRGEVRRKRCAEGRFTCELHALKDKRRGPGWRHSEVFHGPTGLR